MNRLVPLHTNQIERLNTNLLHSIVRMIGFSECYSNTPFECAHCGNIFGDMNLVEHSIYQNGTRNIFCSSSCYSDFNKLKPKKSKQKRIIERDLLHTAFVGYRKFERINKIGSDLRRHKGIYHYDDILPIEGNSCCEILEDHHNKLSADPERLSTDFIKRLSNCRCEKEIP